jgi:hypothetical protein
MPLTNAATSIDLTYFVPTLKFKTILLFLNASLDTVLLTSSVGYGTALHELHALLDPSS